MTKYTPDEAQMYFFAFKYALFYSNDYNEILLVVSFILRSKDRFSDDYKKDMINISKYFIESFNGDGLEDTRNEVKLLKRFGSELEAAKKYDYYVKKYKLNRKLNFPE